MGQPKQAIVLATQNEGKIIELKRSLGHLFECKPLPDSLKGEELPETGNTLEANALQKARFIQEHTGGLALADDTGLEVYALDMRPGVFSARYAGVEKSASKNMEKLLDELTGSSDRRARFRTVVALVSDSGEHCFEGELRGSILNKRRGDKGFGYDPIFSPSGSVRSLAEYTVAEKNEISHRGKAIAALLAFLENKH